MNSKEPLNVPLSVCAVRDDTRLMAEIAAEEQPCRVLDMGTGSGYIAIQLAQLGFDAEGSDINAAAVEAARRNATANGVKARFFQSDLWEKAGKYDLVAFMTPMSNGPDWLKGLIRRIPFSEQLGGLLGYRLFNDFRQSLIGRFIAGADSHLTREGKLLLFASKNETKRFNSMVAQHGFDCTVRRTRGAYAVLEIKRPRIPRCKRTKAVQPN